MYVLVTYKNEDNQMKNEGASVVTTLYSCISDTQEANSVAGGWVWPKSNSFKLLWVYL